MSQIFNIVEELEKERKKNKELEEKIKELKADYGNKAQVERDLLQIRINEAIEYIEKNIGNKNYINSNYTEEYDNYFDVKFEIIDNLLNILKGDNK